jgi:hypothetical protein
MIHKTMCEVLWRNISDFYVNLRVEVSAVSRNRYGVEKTVDTHKILINAKKNMFVFKKYDRQNHVWSFITKYLRFLCKFTSWSCGCIEKQIRCWKNCWYSYNIDKCNKILCLSSRNIMLWKKPSWVAIVKKMWLWSSSVI